MTFLSFLILLGATTLNWISQAILHQPEKLRHEVVTLETLLRFLAQCPLRVASNSGSVCVNGRSTKIPGF